ncbi:MAG TPA: sulfatase-like hydrolase/transferase [Acidimicrobiales bacterium]
MTDTVASEAVVRAGRVVSGRSQSSRPPLRELIAGSAVLVGAAGVAITQPVLDLFGRNPEFFVAGRYGARQIVVFGVLVAVVPALVAVAGTVLASLAHRRFGAVVRVAALAGFAFLFGLVLADHAGIDPVWLALPAAAALAGLVVWLERTRPSVRTLLSYLALGNLAFLVMFLFASPTAEIVAGGSAGADAAATVPPLQGPVVFIILDEFPVTTIMRPDGTINDTRYPNLARLAAGSTWFRNASSISPMTSVAVPSMLTGLDPDGGELPSHIDHPRNLLTLFGHRYPANLYESVTDMCPESICEPGPRGSLRTALRDGSIVYGHQVLPGGLADGLPSIGHSWGGFGDVLGPGDTADPADPAAGPVDASGSGPALPAEPPVAESVVGDDGYARWHSLDAFDRSALGQLTIMRQWLGIIDANPSVNLLHVALPHYPWTLTPWGTRLTQFPNALSDDPESPDVDETGRLRYQLHALQVGAADAAIGEVIDHLQGVGAWDDALVVVSSDHGYSLMPPDFGRTLTDSNREELLRMPLFIKAPGQAEGEVRDDPALTVDILPSIMDLLGIEADWSFDGHSLFDGSEPTRAPKVDPTLQPALDIAAGHAANLGGDDWDGLAAVGIGRDLVGRPVADLATGEPSELTWAPDDQDLFGSLPTDEGRVPYLIAATVTAPDGRQPPEILVAVNGTVAGVAGTQVHGDEGWRAFGLMAPYFRDGANTVEAFEVETTALGPVLRPVGTA